MTVLVKTESPVKKMVWVPDGYINHRPPSTSIDKSGGLGWGNLDFTASNIDPNQLPRSASSSNSGGGRRPRRPSNGDDPPIVIITIEGHHIIISVTGIGGPVVID